MTTKKNTKSALLSSVLATALCIAMLIGTTFAWFTDSVTSGKNKIVAGNLDVELQYSKDAADWKSVEESTDLFADVTLWEPGAASVVYLRMINKGNLALKYQLDIQAVDTVVGTNEKGEEIRLSQILAFGVVDGQTDKFASRADAIAAVAASGKLHSGYTATGEMTSQDGVKNLALVVYMPENVGNEANYRGDKVPQVDLGLSLFATQAAVEEDSFGPDYDEKADLPVVIPAGTTNLTDFINKVGENGTIMLSDNVALDARDGAYFKNDTKAVFDLNNKTLTSEKGLINPTTVIGAYDNSSIQITNGSVAVPADMWRAITAAGSSNLHITDMHLSGGNDGCVTSFENSTISVENTTITAETGGCLYANGGSVNVYSGDYSQGGKAVSAWFNALVMASNMGEVNVYGGVYTGTTYGVYVFNSGGTINIHGGTFTAGNTVLKADYNTGASTINVYGGSFDGKISIASNATLHIEAGTFANTGLTAEQFDAYVADGHTFTEEDGVFTVK